MGPSHDLTASRRPDAAPERRNGSRPDGAGRARCVLISAPQMLTETVGALVADHDGFEVVSERNGGRPAADVIVLDAGGEEAETAVVADRLRRSHPTADFVLLGPGAPQSRALTESLGKYVWVSYDADPDTLLAILSGDTRRDGASSPGAGRGPCGDDEELQGLTRREHQILMLLADGWRADDIADKFEISSHTVRTHVQNMMRKLGVTSRFEAITVARRVTRRRDVPGGLRPAPADTPRTVRAGGPTVVLGWASGLERAGMRKAFEASGMSVVAETADADSVVEAILASGPEVAVVPADLPGDGVWACAAVKAAGAGTRIVMTSPGPDPAVLRSAVEAGADGYLAGPSGVDEIVDVVNRVAAGEAVIPGSMLATLLRELIKGRREEDAVVERFSRLSKRERRILGLLAKGLDPDGIAAELYVSPHTARTHIQNILRKLEVHSRGEAVALVDDFDLLERFGPVEGS